MNLNLQDTKNGPHQGQPVYVTGERLENAEAAMVLVHGRGASAQDILFLSAEFTRPGFAYLAPEAAGGIWYPNRFYDFTASNEPWLSSALGLVGKVMAHVETSGIPAEKTILLGFSQGACLALEYAARNPRRYGGVAGLSGGLIGADNELRQGDGTLDGTPIFLGCSDVDPHIPKGRVEQTARILGEKGATVTMRLYPGMGHTVNQDEIKAIMEMMDAVKGNKTSKAGQ